ncbi:hypothetical protein CDAR_561141 [Caerostris darwini]|uniref:Uncharacterized protein n=1 Tax=Caerostris darwini TaxID=1538125 RepID=A0AAV4TC88_9ARAC|nr:hypothetical protein CDAR_561141 [Caerostris darwini]
MEIGFTYHFSPLSNIFRVSFSQEQQALSTIQFIKIHALACANSNKPRPIFAAKDSLLHISFPCSNRKQLLMTIPRCYVLSVADKPNPGTEHLQKLLHRKKTKKRSKPK